MSIDLGNIPIAFNRSREQLKSQVSSAALFLLRNEKPADLVRDGSGSQRALERGSEGSSGAKGKGAAALRGLSKHNYNRSCQ